MNHSYLLVDKFFSLYCIAGFSSIPLLRHQHINPVRCSNLLTHPQDQSSGSSSRKARLQVCVLRPSATDSSTTGNWRGSQFWVRESCGLSAAPWWVVFSFPLPAGQSVQGRGLTDVGLFALLFFVRACFCYLVQAWKYSQYLQYISSALDRKTKPARGTYPGSKHCFDIVFSSAVNK